MVTENEVVLAIDKVRAMLGELKSMAHNYEALHRSRDRWKKFAEEHESELNALAVEMAHSWVKLPVDAEGVPIHVGDVLDGYGKTIEVVDMRYGRSGWVLIGRDGNGYADTLAFAHHHEQRTVDDVLSDFANDVIRCCDDREKLEAAAAEIRGLLVVGE